MKFFTADTHFWHKNILKYTNRPFKHIDEMNEAMINNWNSVVGKDDEIYHVGDLSFGETDKTENVLRRLNGNKFLILGNHDKDIIRGDLKKYFTWVGPYKEIYVDDPDAARGKQSIVLMHYAMRIWNKSHHGAWQLFGHSHGSLPDDPNSLSIDVGVDCHNFKPISYDEVKAIMQKKTWKPVDHHGERE